MEWANEGAKAGGRAIHAWTQAKVPPRLLRAIEDTLIKRADASIHSCKSEVWDANSAESFVFDDLAPDQISPRPQVQALRAAYNTFGVSSGVGVDWLRPKTLVHLSDAALSALIDIFMLVELMGQLPSFRAYTILVAIPKPSGIGERPIALLPTFHRGWARLLSGLARDWEKRLDRPYFACKAGGSAVDAVYDCCFHDELALSLGWHSSAIISDLSKCYEMVRLSLL